VSGIRRERQAKGRKSANQLSSGAEAPAC